MKTKKTQTKKNKNNFFKPFTDYCQNWCFYFKNFGRKKIRNTLQLLILDKKKYNSCFENYFKKIKKVDRNNTNKNKIIEIENITKSYRKKNIVGVKDNVFLALDNISFSLNKGEMIGIVGRNGSGKTTLAEIIVGFREKTTGTIKYNFDYKFSAAEAMGVSFQKNNLVDSLTPLDYIKFFHRSCRSNLDVNDICMLLLTFGLENFYTRKLAKLSGGQQQRLNVLLSFLNSPKILFLDELSNNLDVNIKNKVFLFIKKYVASRNATGLIIAHDAKEIRTLCSKVLVLENGKQKIYSPVVKINIERIFKTMENKG